MDAMSDRKIEKVVIMGAHQSGKTDMMNNDIGMHIDVDPCSMMFVRYSIEMAEEWSKDRLAPMIRDTPVLRKIVKDPKSRNSENTIMHKKFPGGSLAITGSNSPASLASRPIQRLYCDDIDRFEVTKEGDSVDIAEARTETFYNKKIILNSTPRDKGIEKIVNGKTEIVGGSRIEAAYEESDMRQYLVPCLKCDVYDVLSWPQVVWPKGLPQDARYQCLHCGVKHTDGDINKMVLKGYWQAQKPFNGTAGFWFNAIYSPWVSLAKMATQFLKVKKNNDRLRVFVNTMLAETWDTQQLSDGVPWQKLYNRREKYNADVPTGGLVLTLGGDIQGDRIECEVVAHGLDEESWTIAYVVFQGDPLRPPVWNLLDDYLKKTFTHESGVKLRIVTACIDSGYLPDEVYRFTKPRQTQRIYSTKGSSIVGKPLVGRVSTSNAYKAKLFPIGTDTAKMVIYGRLNIKEPGPGYMHFSDTQAEEYYKGMCSEQLDPKGKWVKTRARNEPLDCRVLNNAAFALLEANMEQISAEINHQAAAIEHGVKPRARGNGRRVLSKGVKR